MTSKKDYEAIADVILREAKTAKYYMKNEQPGDAVVLISFIVEGLIEVFEKTNPRFDIDKFEKACGRGVYFDQR